MSPREQVARNLAETCVFGGLNESYGVNVEKTLNARGKSYWGVTFAKARTLDGAIQIYSPTFIVVKWQTAFRHVVPRGSRRFTSEATAKEFITEKFVNVV